MGISCFGFECVQLRVVELRTVSRKNRAFIVSIEVRRRCIIRYLSLLPKQAWLLSHPQATYRGLHLSFRVFKYGSFHVLVGLSVCDEVVEVKSLALSSYDCLPLRPAVFPLLHRKNPMAPNKARPTIVTPTAMPALAPVESFPLLELCDELEAGRPVAEGLPLCVGSTNLSLVTLKQGTWMLKSLVSTKVCSRGSACRLLRVLEQDYHNIPHRRRQRRTGSCRCSRPRTRPSTPAGWSRLSLARCLLIVSAGSTGGLCPRR